MEKQPYFLTSKHNVFSSANSNQFGSHEPKTSGFEAQVIMLLLAQEWFWGESVHNEKHWTTQCRSQNIPNTETWTDFKDNRSF